MVQPLLITPQPKLAESLQGFILRTSEANGYDSPSRILTYAGLGWQASHSARPSLNKLAVLYGRGVDHLVGLGCIPDQDSRAKKGKHQAVMGHTLQKNFFLTGRSRVCPDCVLETGIVESYWELRYAVACPIHKKYAIAICPKCNGVLSWFRRGLLVCECGQDLSQTYGETLTQPEMLALLGVIRAKLLRDPLDMQQLETVGFPIGAIERMSLATLLGIIRCFEHSFRHLDAYQKRPGVTSETLGLSGAMDLLSQWPHGLHDYLVRVHLNQQSHSLRGSSDSFYERFFKSGLPFGEIEFIRKEFMDFGMRRWGLASSANLIGSKTQDKAPETEAAPRRVPHQSPLIKADGDSLSLKDAAKRVRLPFSVLKLLRENGVYQPRYLAVPDEAFHEHDLDRFRGELMGNALNTSRPRTIKDVSLCEVMHMSLGSQQVKADLVAAVHAKELKPIGRGGDAPGRLLFDRAQVVEFLKESKSRHNRLLTTGKAAKRLECSYEVIRQLALDGVLEHVEKPLGVYIKQESLERFSEEYVSCLAIARAHACGVSRIMHLCEVSGVKLIRFERSGGGSAQPFIKREQTGLIGF